MANKNGGGGRTKKNKHRPSRAGAWTPRDPSAGSIFCLDFPRGVGPFYASCPCGRARQFFLSWVGSPWVRVLFGGPFGSRIGVLVFNFFVGCSPGLVILLGDSRSIFEVPSSCIHYWG